MTRRSPGRILFAVTVAAGCMLALAHVGQAEAASSSLVRTVTIRYRAFDGTVRRAYVVVPSWYGPGRDPTIPLVISPHGRGVDGRANAKLWGDLPGQDGFAVVNPDGQGRRLGLYSWGYQGQIDDLARMPSIVRNALPWLRIDRRRIYGVGGSMGGQEVLLLVAQHPRLLAGAVAMDAPTNMALRYEDFPLIPDGQALQQLANVEVGGTPATDPRAYAERSPLSYATAIARSGVPLQIWWSVSDQIVLDQRANSGALYQQIHAINPEAPVTEVVGTWRHSAEMTATWELPVALRGLQLTPTAPPPPVAPPAQVPAV